MLFPDLENKLKGQPDIYISIALIGIAIGATILALYADAKLKAAVLAWMVFP